MPLLRLAQGLTWLASLLLIALGVLEGGGEAAYASVGAGTFLALVLVASIVAAP